MTLEPAIAPPDRLTDWLHLLDDPNWPVQASTALRLEELRQQEDTLGNVSINMLAQDLGDDPLLVLKVLVSVSQTCVARDAAPPETLLGAVLMLGIGPFFRLLPPQRSLETALSQRPEVLQGFAQLLERSRQSAHWAHQFACHRGDTDADILHQAGLLHDFVEWLLWWKAPDLALSVQAGAPIGPEEPPAQRQRRLLGCTLPELAMALMHHWHLPDLLIRCCDEAHAEHPQVQTVLLAARLAQHTRLGWGEATASMLLPDDLEAIAVLLNISVGAVRHKLDIDALPLQERLG